MSFVQSVRSLFLIDELPQLLSSERHVNVCNAECISHSVRDCWGRTNRPSLADAFHSERIDRSQGDSAVKLKGRELWSHRHGIIHEGRCQELTVLVVDDLLPHGLSNPLSDATMDLSLN